MTDNRTALVTGANKGIGLEIARGLGKLGYTVWLGSRDQRRGEAAADVLRNEGLDIRSLTIDVADDVSVEAATEALAGATDKLDVLVNNAGISTGWVAPSNDRILDVRTIYEVNVFGAIRATQAFLPLLKASDAPRIVMMSSSLGSLAWASDFDAPGEPARLQQLEVCSERRDGGVRQGTGATRLQSECRLSRLHGDRSQSTHRASHPGAGCRHRCPPCHAGGRRPNRRVLR